jgi:hypothetical protein
MTERQNISSGGPLEAKVGYSRAVRFGNHVVVAGATTLTSDVIRTRSFITDISLVEDFGGAHGEIFAE